MADIKPEDNKNRTRRLLLFSLLAVAVIATLAVMKTARPIAPEYRRYVGPPLADGSRMTFLYPTALNRVLVSPNAPPAIIQSVQMVESLAGLPQSVLRLLPSWQRAYPTNDLTIGALAMKVSARVPVTSGRSAARKRVQQPIKGQGDIYVEAVTITNAKTKTEYVFNYSYLAFSTPSLAFVKREAVITNSFQVLPPGAAVPTP